jgi:spore coat polysaccharide biosynthesis protein SpsF (cytidylyltransferase family)
LGHGLDILQRIATKNGTKFFRGNLNNKLKRRMDCAAYFNLKSFHTIDADDPFFDGGEMIESMDELSLNNYDFVHPSKYS